MQATWVASLWKMMAKKPVKITLHFLKLGNRAGFFLFKQFSFFFFLYHGHLDHIGGLSDFLKVHQARVIVTASLTGVEGVTVLRVSEPLQIHDNIFSTGELVNNEQALIVKSREGYGIS